MLEYDDTAFYYFALTILSFYLVPGGYYAIMETLRAFEIVGDKTVATARTKSELSKVSRIKESATGTKRLKRWPFMLNLCLLIPATIFFLFLTYSVRSDGEMARFDPFVILGIEQNAAEKDIKKAYRRMSLKYHPDKNVGDKVAEETFMKVAKAYEALTDETSKENYEKFGNPDGKQSLEVSIGLPKIILENPKVVLVLYLIMIVVVIPIAVGIWYTYSKQYGEKNVKYETYAAFYRLLTENHKIKHMPEVLAASAESRKIMDRQPEKEEALALGNIAKKAETEKLMLKPTIGIAKRGVPMSNILKGNILLHMHMRRMHNELIPAFKKDLDDVLCHVPDLMEGLIEMSYQRKWVQTTTEAIKFSQCLMQATWDKSSPFLQLPHMTEKNIPLITKGSKSPSLFASFIRNPLADKSMLQGMSEGEKSDIVSACNVIPHMKIDWKLFVEEEENDSFFEDEENEESGAVAESPSRKGKAYNRNLSKKGEIIRGDSIYQGDLVTLRVTMDRENVAEGDKAPMVHAPYFPRTINEIWWLLLTETAGANTNEPNIHAVERIVNQNKTVTHEIRFMAPAEVGDFKMDLHVLSEVYAGLDQKIAVKFSVLSAEDLPEYVAHEEDVELDNEPTLFEQVMSANLDEEDSDDDDEDDEDEADERHDIVDDDDDD